MKEALYQAVREVEIRVIEGGGKGGKEGDTKVDISRVEIRVAIKKLKDEKAVGIDEIPNEVWKYEGERVEK